MKDLAGERTATLTLNPYDYFSPEATPYIVGRCEILYNDQSLSHLPVIRGCVSEGWIELFEHNREGKITADSENDVGDALRRYMMFGRIELRSTLGCNFAHLEFGEPDESRI